MVRCMVGMRGVFSVLVTRLCSDMTSDGKRLVPLDIADEMADSMRIMAWLKNNEPGKPTCLFMDYCQYEINPGSLGTLNQLSAMLHDG